MGKLTTQSSRNIEPSSGNVFADLGIEDAPERQTKVHLAIAINAILQKKGMPQAKAAEVRGINQPKVSALAKYRLEGFSVERLMRFLTALNQDIEIVIRNRPRARRPGRLRQSSVRRSLSNHSNLGTSAQSLMSCSMRCGTRALGRPGRDSGSARPGHGKRQGLSDSAASCLAN